MPWNVERSTSGTNRVGTASAPKAWSLSKARNPRLWVWTWSPGSMGAVAKPMIWLYLRTASPAATGATATLCPRGTFARTTSAPAESPSCRSRVATRTLSSGCSCTPRRSRGGATLIGSSHLNRCGRRSSVPGCQLPVLVEAQGRRHTGDLQVRPVLDLAAEELGDQQVLQVQGAAQAHQDHPDASPARPRPGRD